MVQSIELLQYGATTADTFDVITPVLLLFITGNQFINLWEAHATLSNVFSREENWDNFLVILDLF